MEFWVKQGGDDGGATEELSYFLFSFFKKKILSRAGTNGVLVSISQVIYLHGKPSNKVFVYKRDPVDYKPCRIFPHPISMSMLQVAFDIG